nr:hypothetical protein [Tanacetum cinerariifolium]
MPIKSNEPPDPPFDKMTSADDIVHSLLNEYMDKVTRKARGRADDSPGDNRSGKRAAISPRNDEIGKLLHGLSPLENSVLNEHCSPVVKSCGPKTSLDHTGMGDVGNTSCGLASLKDGIASAETGNVCDRDIAGSGTGSEHTNMDDVNVNYAGVLKKPLGPIFNVQYSNVVKSNPFGRSNNGKGIGVSNGGWNVGVRNKFGFTVLSNQFFAAVDRFAEKLKEGEGKDGMKKVLESGLWMVQNVPLVLKVLEPGKLDFTRVLVEVSANDDLPSSLEISYPPICNRPAKVGVLYVKYQWKPPLCTHCKTFGHTTLSCKVRPRTKEEIAAKNLRDALKIRKPVVDDSGNNNVDDEGFTVIGKKNRVQRRFGGGVQGNQFQQKGSFNARNNGVKGMSNGKNNIGNKAHVQEVKKKSLVMKPVLASTLDPSYEDDGVATDDGVMAKKMRVEDVDLGACNSNVSGAPSSINVLNV